MRTFVDTNVLVYAHDRDAGRKRDIALTVIRDLWERREGVLSPQVLQEFYVNATRKIPKPISKADARDLLDAYALWTVVAIDAADVRAAADLEERHKVSFWDALIIRAALKANAEVLLSEDLHATGRIGGLDIRNPFAEA